MGVVVKQGYRKKSITVQVKYKAWYNRSQVFVPGTKYYHVHDETEAARTGDIVIIKQMQKVGKTKNYYLRNIEKECGRNDYWSDQEYERNREVNEAMKEIKPKVIKDWHNEFHYKKMDIKGLIDVRK